MAKNSNVIVVGIMAFVLGISAPAGAHVVERVAKQISGSTIKANTITGKQVKESTLGIVPKAKLATTATEAKSLPPLVFHKLTIQPGWTVVGTVAPAYAIDAEGVVHLQGVIAGPLDTEAFVLPVKARPIAQIYLINTITLNATGALAIDTDGSVYPQAKGSTAVSTYDSLDGLSYPTN